MEITATESSIIIAALGVTGAWLQTRRSRDGSRSQIKQDLELFQLLPEQSKARTDLLAHIEKEVSRLVQREDELTRDPLGSGIAIFILLASAGLFILPITNGGWWWLLVIPAVFFAILGSVGIGQSLPRRQRDAKGNKVNAET